MTLTCYVVDDEELCLLSLVRMLGQSGRAEVVGSSTDPTRAVLEIQDLRPQAIFLDIHMPDLDGFQVLAALPNPPLAVFTTAYDQFAVRAFEVNSVDYLLKPVGYDRLQQSLGRLVSHISERHYPPLDTVLASVTEALRPKTWPLRIGIQSGENTTFLELDQVTHFVSEDRYTYACTGHGRFMVTASLGDLETRLDPDRFLRIHRSTIVNLHAIQQISRWFAGRVLVRLQDRTELTVSRDKVKELRAALDLESPAT
ncbi:MAG: LytTR family DNA-binding domain-containing protein [Terracidiphilus sp.]